MAAFTTDQLDLPVERAARLVALDLLAEMAAARERLGVPDDDEALHDFRVALRRLRSWLRAYRPYLAGSVRGKDRRRLTAIVDGTGASRDIEVHIAWLRDQRPLLPTRQRSGLDWLIARLEARKAEADATLLATVARDFARIHRGLDGSLAVYRVTVQLRRPTVPHSLAAVTADLVRAQADELRASLALVRGVTDQEEAHRTRIAGKRLRYVLEPLREAVPETVDVVRQLKALQDGLGDLHDAHVLAGEITTALEQTAAEHARRLAATVLDGPADGASPRPSARDPRAGLVAIARRLRERSDQAFATLEREWMGTAAAGFFAQVAAVADTLAVRAAPPPVEIERKYLLRAFPPEAAGGEIRQIWQGYVPGRRVVERVRRVRMNGEERWYRTVKFGVGMARIELEEETTHEIFAALWRLTRGRRLRKTRFVVPEDGLRWEIDRFDDRNLVLAEVELPAVDTPVEPPAWLGPYVLREVTGEATYQNSNLAR